MKSKGKGLVSPRPEINEKKGSNHKIVEKGSVVKDINFVNEWTYTLAEFSGNPRCVRKIMNSEEKNET